MSREKEVERKPCSRCGGSGFDPAFDGDGPMECRRCDGSGKEPK